MDPSTQLLIAKFVVPGMFGLAGIFSLIQYFSTRKRHNWPQTKGAIVSSGVKEGVRKGKRGQDITSFWAAVRYQYQVNNQEHHCEQIARQRVSFSSPAHAQLIADQFPVGQSVAVWHNPEDPQEAFLSPGGETGGKPILALAITFFAFDALLSWWLFTSM